MKKILLILLVAILGCGQLTSQPNIRKVATWNMKWLGTNSGNQLDAVEMIPEYAEYIKKTGATLFALQEIGVSHSLEGSPRCYYLDLIVQELNKEGNNSWEYLIDERNGNQRLAFLFNEIYWEVSNPYSFTPGSSFNYIRRPFITSVKSIGDNAELEFNFINIHLKAFPDQESREKRRSNFLELASWLETAPLDGDVLIAGDTNLYSGEADLDNSLDDIDYKALFDREPTSIHDYQLSQRFDRFFSSPDLMNEIESAKELVGNADYIDVIKQNDEEFLKWYDDNISDHFPVILNIDVSEER